MLKESVVKQRAIDAVGQAGAIVDAKAPAEVAEVKRWLLATANQVADAAKKGGFLGFGEVTVSDAGYARRPCCCFSPEYVMGARY